MPPLGPYDPNIQPAGAAGIGGPPLPPDMPSLRAFRPTALGGAGRMAPGPAQGGALPRLIFGIEQTLDVLAQAIPGSAEKIDTIKGLLREVLVTAGSGEAPGEAPEI